jgi:hypothetical protein
MSETSATNGAQTTPASPPDEAEAIRVGPFHEAVIADQVWAEEQFHNGAFADSMGMYVAVVDREVKGKGCHVAELLRQVRAQHPEVHPNRFALFYVDPGDD